MDKKINFHFHPYKYEDKLHVVEKEEHGKKRKYLIGFSSGIKEDLHGDMISANCIKDFMTQSKNGEILLYADKHEVAATDDIGILTNATIEKDGSWKTEYRLYDEDDNVGSNTLEKVDKLWRQVNGIKPYKKSKQKGFSIEGHIPEKDGIIQMANGKRIINKVLLDGVVVVPRPAYQYSIANAIYKALGEENIIKVKKDINTRLQQRIDNEEQERSFYEGKWKYTEALDDEIKFLMENSNIENKEERLNVLFDEYKIFMIKFLMEHKDFFEFDSDSDSEIIENSKKSLDTIDSSMIYKQLSEKLALLKTKIS